MSHKHGTNRNMLYAGATSTARLSLQVVFQTLLDNSSLSSNREITAQIEREKKETYTVPANCN